MLARNCTVMTVAALLAGCATTTPTPTRPALISHIVFFNLAAPADRDELIVDCDAMAAAIPEVTTCAAGVHLDTGRDNVDGDYDVGLYVGFESEADYRIYVDHDAHKALVEKWGPKLEGLKVYDIVDE